MCSRQLGSRYHFSRETLGFLFLLVGVSSFFTLKFGEDLIFNLWVSYDFQLAKNNCPPTEKTKTSQQHLILNGWRFEDFFCRGRSRWCRREVDTSVSCAWHEKRRKQEVLRSTAVYDVLRFFSIVPTLKKKYCNPLRILGPHLLTGGMKSHWDPGSLQVTIPMNRPANTDIATFLGKHCFARSKISTPFLITCGK